MRVEKGRDFRVGDKITLFEIEKYKGYISDIFSHEDTDDISFDVFDIKRDRKVFHGHNIQMDVKGEEKPSRLVTRYMNLFWGLDNKVTASVTYHRTPKEAFEDAEFQEERCNISYVKKSVEIEVPEEIILCQK